MYTHTLTDRGSNGDIIRVAVVVAVVAASFVAIVVRKEGHDPKEVEWCAALEGKRQRRPEQAVAEEKAGVWKQRFLLP